MKISEVKELLNQENISEKNHFTKINVIIMDVSIFVE